MSAITASHIVATEAEKDRLDSRGEHDVLHDDRSGLPASLDFENRIFIKR